MDIAKARTRLQARLNLWRNNRRLAAASRRVARQAQPVSGQAPVVVFNASARLKGLSQNAAFSLLASWGLRLEGSPLIHFVCRSGMSHCVLGLDRSDFSAPPPCEACIAESHRQYAGAEVAWFTYQRDPRLAETLEGLSVEQLCSFETSFPWNGPEQPVLPLGRLALPSMRWALRRHHIPDDEAHRRLFREFILSAYSLAGEFDALLERIRPAVALIFNGIMYPEATARWIALQRGVRVITHEVGFQPTSAFFTDGQATAYPIHIPEGFELDPGQNARLDAYLEKRFQGQFTMAGIRFWPEMHGLDESLLGKMATFRQVVPIFTNVVYDTSQLHANVVFPHMFAWLELLLETIHTHPETLFVIRAHPDEMRPNSAKQSRESVRDWVQRNRVSELDNVVFIDSQEYVSSYELIQRSKFVVVYNSSIGLEAALMGKAVLCGGKARYTQYPIVFFPATMEAYRRQAEDFLAAEEIAVPEEFQRNARRFLHYQLFRVSLPFDRFLEPGDRQGFIRLKPFHLEALQPDESPTIRAIVKGTLSQDEPTGGAAEANPEKAADRHAAFLLENADEREVHGKN